MDEYFLYALLALASVGVAWGAFSDVRSFRIPNAANLLILLSAIGYGIFLAKNGLWLGNLFVAIGVFLVCLLLFSFGRLGGGDVKMIVPLSFWAGPYLILPFLVVVALIGGVMALGYLGAFLLLRPAAVPASAEGEGRSLRGLIVAYLRYASVAEVSQAGSIIKELKLASIRVPYGVAIAGGAVYLFTSILGQVEILGP